MTNKERFDALMSEGKIVGTRRIVPFLRYFMDLNDDGKKAWRTVKAWKKSYNLPIHEELNHQPSVIPSEIVLFFMATPEGFKKGVTKGDFLRFLADCQ